MPRPPVHSTLPPLEKLLPRFAGLSSSQGKAQGIADALRPAVVRHRHSVNQTFHTTREIARFFGVCQQTASLAAGMLEREGLLRRVRGAQTVVTGARNITRVKLRAVAGFPLGQIEAKYSYAHRRLFRELSDDLWRHHITLDSIPYVEIGGNLPDFNQRLHRHGLNFVVWLTPLSHTRDAMLHLEDQGVRNLVIDLNTRTAGFQSDVVIDMLKAYSGVAARWRKDFGVRRVLVIEASDYARERITNFTRIMEREGFDCTVLKNSPSLSGEIEAAHRTGEKIGIALLDERATAEFTFWNPGAFVTLARRHRVLYGSNYPEVPFAGHGETKIDRIVINHIRLTEVTTATLVRWLNRDFSFKPVVIDTETAYDIPLWRYL